MFGAVDVVDLICSRTGLRPLVEPVRRTKRAVNEPAVPFIKLG